MQLTFSQDDPLHTTLAGKDGKSVYHIRTDGAFSTFRTTTTSIYRTDRAHSDIHGEQQEAVGQIAWGRLGRRDTVRSALFGAGGDKVRVKDLLFSDNAFRKSRLFIAADEQVYKWKWDDNRGLQLIHVESDTVKALYSPANEREQISAFLKIHASCTLETDIIILTFIIVEKKRRDALADGAEERESPEALAEAGVESAAM